MLGRCCRRTESLFEKRHTDALGTAHFLKRRRRPGLPFIISANSARRTEMTLPSSARPATDCVEETLLFLRLFRRDCPASLPNARPNAASTFSAWRMGNRSTAAELLAFDKPDFQLSHEASRRHPEIVPHHHDALDSATIALPKGLNQFRVLFFLLGMEPLLELIQDDQHLLANRDALSSSQCRQRFFQAQLSSSAGQRFRSPCSKRVSVSSGVASM